MDKQKFELCSESKKIGEEKCEDSARTQPDQDNEDSSCNVNQPNTHESMQDRRTELNDHLFHKTQVGLQDVV